jgi:hypothetical protein
LFDQFYASFEGKGGLNIALMPLGSLRSLAAFSLRRAAMVRLPGAL